MTQQRQPPSPDETASRNAEAVTSAWGKNAVVLSYAAPSSSSWLRRLAGKVVDDKFFPLLLYADPEKLDYILLFAGIIGAICSGFPFPFLGILFGKLVDDINSSACAEGPPANLESMVRKKVIAVTCVAVANFSLIYLYMGCWTLFGERLVRRLRTRYLSALLRQEAAFFDGLPAGEVASRLDTDLQTIQAGVSEKVGIYLASLSYFLAAYVVAFITDARLAIILFALVPTYYVMVKVGNHFTGKYTNAVADAVADASSIASECLSNIQIVHAFGLESRLEAIFTGHLLKAQPAAIRNFITAACQLGFLYFVAYSANAVAIWQGSMQIGDAIAQKSDFTIGHVYTCILVLIDASFILTQVSPFMQIFSSAAVSAQKLFDTIDRTSEIDGTSDFHGQILPTFRGNIEFKHVSFVYPSRPDAQVLDGLTLSVEAGKVTAIVGSSGSGKSTLASLIPRVYDVTGGEVSVDGLGVKELNTRYLRSNIAVVEQNPALFDASILENIAFGLVGSPRRDHLYLQPALLNGSLEGAVKAAQKGRALDHPTDPAVQKIIALVQDAAGRASVMEFADRLEHGLATQVGVGGRQLSGGQKQRVAIARALVRDSPVLILDEATSALDSISEKKIQAALEESCKGKTLVVIAHRLSTIKNADTIMAMAKGRVVEQGTYSELLEKDGLFASLVRLQDIEKETNKAAVADLVDVPSGSAAGDKSDNGPSDKELDEKAEMGDIDLDSDGEDLPLLESDPAYKTEKEEEPLQAKQHSFVSTFIRVVGLARKWRIYIWIGSIAAIVVGGSHSGEALIFGNMIGAINPCREEAFVRRAGIVFSRLFFLLAVVEFSGAVARGSAFGFVAEKLVVKTRVLTLRSLLSQDVAWHESAGRTPDKLLGYLTTDTTSLSGMTGSVLGISFSIIVSLVLGVTISHFVAWKIAIVLLATVPVLLASGYLRLRMLARFHEKHTAAFTQSVAVAKEAVDCIRTVAAFSLEDLALHAYRRALHAPYAATLRAITLGNFWLALSYSISNLVYALAYWWGAKLTANATYSQTQFFIVLPALLFSSQACGQFFSLAPDMSRAGVAARRILELIEQGPKGPLQPPPPPAQPDDSVTASFKAYDEDSASDDDNDDEEAALGLPLKQLPSPTTSPTAQGIAIAFNNVRFSYPSRPGTEALKGLTLNIRANTFAALTGPSGSGKSTAFALIERFYAPDSGTVTLDGVMASASARAAIALVPQECALFDGSVAFNIGLGSAGSQAPTQAEIEAAARAANVHDAIAALPAGYATRCGARGSQFSGGQRQRLAIARALVRRPRLLLLDEPTSALDAESEAVWQETLGQVVRGSGVTVVVIAHRLATIRKAHCIFYVDGGVCVDSGGHDELLRRNEMYRRSVLLQTLS
ncbi:uncharacterized protein K452DRAFT_321290 [Aplosporella prunicola CBS 121167]|uniref:Leptomycin B resistance protein pmd1 n=1 Tax=Aplosporella prunicola CBS 121167 TaxID=1176127 RepID=A0A6A6B6C4_9PEZI|nr:uncharacterized protein K452DRAFT_321290 [Aplosporella prunicola CBS 121167]KAF2138331.1 hypothetical protein K452DRAFT_321290 [Aplosporella prunicola CBS 121167]